MNFKKIILINFGQYAGTPFYFELAKQLNSEFDVVFITDQLSVKRLRHSFDVNIKITNFKYEDIRQTVIENIEEDSFVLFGNIIFAIPCIDYLIKNNVKFSVQSTIFFRKLHMNCQKARHLETNQNLYEIFEKNIVPNYSYLYTIASSEKNKCEMTRGEFWAQLASYGEIIEYENLVWSHCIKFYSYYKEPYKLDVIRTLFSEYKHKVSSLIPSVPVKPSDNIDEILNAKPKQHTLVFFCSANEFYYWEGPLVIEVLKKLPLNFNLVVLGNIPKCFLANIDSITKKRITFGIVNNGSVVTDILQKAICLIGLRRQMVSFSVLEAIQHNVLCVFTSEIKSYNESVLERKDDCGALYISDKNPDSIAKSILETINNYPCYKNHIIAQTKFIEKNYNIEHIKKQLIKDCNEEL